MKVEIWSDIACPFCYIGKRRFEAALQDFGGKAGVEIKWRSFQLDPAARPEPGKTMAQVLAEKKGWTEAQTAQMFDQVTRMAAEAGLHYQMDKTVVANTLDAHRLTHLAAVHGLQHEVEERLFKAYFVEGADIGSPDVLRLLGTEIGLPEAEINAMLESNNFYGDVQRDLLEAQQVGVQGVPFFVFNDKYAVSGAQAPEVFGQVLQKVWAEEQPAIQTLDGGVCAPDGTCT